MKKLFTLLTLLSWVFIAKSQVKESFYLLDAEGYPTKAKSAHFLIHKHQINDTCWQLELYNYMGPMIKSERYRDEEGKEMDGISYHYNKQGLIDSSANFIRGKKNGASWKFSGDSLKYRVKYIYRDDSLKSVIIPDSVKKDSLIGFGDVKESEYPGGLKAWYQFLSKNLQYPERAQKAVIQGMVAIRFIVDENGNVVEPVVGRSVEFSIDEEAIRIIRVSGKWEPAYQNGHNVKSYKSQPMNFRLMQLREVKKSII